MELHEAEKLYTRIKRDIKIAAYVMWAGGAAIYALYSTMPVFKDDTDGDKRSGMMLSVDAQTGCHYLRTQAGGITPRLNREGRHVCE